MPECVTNVGFCDALRKLGEAGESVAFEQANH